MTTYVARFALALPLAALLCGAAPAEEGPFDQAAVGFFEKKIRPLLVNNCYTCHSANTNSKGGLRVDDRVGLVRGGEHGAAVVPGRPEDSLLIKAVRRSESLKMPPEKELSPEEISDLTQWIQDGAAWPAVEVPSDLGHPDADYETLRAEHWAWQPLKTTALPAVDDLGWPQSDIDTFILAKLEQSQLAPVADSDRAALIRRLSFDLTGLPPSLDEVDGFLADVGTDALERLVDRLLASPAFGERWGRHWLDIARYGESTGSSRNLPFPHAWRYRDYVIRAFNEDKPFDKFIREQIAGDLLPADSPEGRDQLRIATGFLALGVKDVNQRFKVRFVMDNIDEQIDTVSRAVLALTVSCARCHDHKFDPIPSSDYYALAGIFHSSDLCAGLRNKMGGGGLDYYNSSLLLPLGAENQKFQPTPEMSQKIEELKKQVAAARQAFQALRDSPEGGEQGPDGRPKRAIAREKMNKLQAELLALEDPLANGAQAAMGVRDAKEIGDTEVRIRGEAEQIGPLVPRGFLGLLRVAQSSVIPSNQSGRLELAQWLTAPDNPLTPRVIVNRIWQHLFGEGLVKTVDNFGVNGDVPSHPELLDHLAARFVRDGWSIKRLARRIVLSRAYRLSSVSAATQREIDPANRLVWRHSPRRLEAEELRDSLLSAAGALDRAVPHGSPAMALRVVELRNNGPEARRLMTTAVASQHRSVYLSLLRGVTPRSLEVFDFAEQGMVTGRRDATTVATQALYLLNDAFVGRQSLALASRLLDASQLDDTERINRAYRLTLGRTASTAEIERVLRYLAEYEQEASPELARIASANAAQASADVAANPDTNQSSSQQAKKPPQNPDEADQTDAPQKEEWIQARSGREAAWASFCQALFGSAEFRYLP